jgi:hypothetical protein
MAQPDLEARIASAREAVISLGGRFAETSRRVVEAALNRAVEQLVVRRADWFNRLDDRAATALREAVQRTIQRSAAKVEERLKEPDVWLAPSVVTDGGPQPQLDEWANRVWIALLNAADPLDPVLTEFGLQPSDVPDRGGGHFGLQPKNLGELDPGGSLARLWSRYRRLYETYRKTLRAPQQLSARRDENEARRRWNQPT